MAVKGLSSPRGSASIIPSLVKTIIPGGKIIKREMPRGWISFCRYPTEVIPTFEPRVSRIFARQVRVTWASLFSLLPLPISLTPFIYYSRPLPPSIFDNVTPRLSTHVTCTRFFTANRLFTGFLLLIKSSKCSHQKGQKVNRISSAGN